MLPDLYPEGMRAILSPYTGIVRNVSDQFNLPDDPTVYTSTAVPCDPAAFRPDRVQFSGGGAALTRVGARMAALGEAVERYASGFYDPHDLVFGSYRELSVSHPVTAPSRYALFHKSQYGKIPFAPFTDETPAAWAWGFSLSRGEPVLVPAVLVHIPYHLTFPGERHLTYPTSTGLACAGSSTEATLKGLCEAIERDSFMILWLNRLPHRRIPISIDRGLSTLLKERLVRNGLHYTVVETTTEIGVPSVLCLLVDQNAKPPMVLVGGAASVTLREAVIKALVEAAHCLLWARYLTLQNARPKKKFEDIESFDDHSVLFAYGDMKYAVQFLLDAPEMPEAEAQQKLDEQPPGDVATRLSQCIEKVRHAGYEPIAFDLTTEDIAVLSLSVVRVVVPGLCLLDAAYRYRFLGGDRLYEVPHILGYRRRRTRLSELNPIPHPYP